MITSIHLGGSEIVAFNLAENCKLERSNEIEFIVVELYQTQNDYSKQKAKDIISKGIRIISLCKCPKRLSLVVAPFRLLRHLIIEKPQIIHSHTDLPDFALAVCLRFLSWLRITPPKIIRTIHSTQLWATHDKLGKFTEKAFKNDWIVGVSISSLTAYNELRLKNQLSASQHQCVIYNGCSIPVRKEHPFKIDKYKINIAFCGRFEDHKGISVLIKRIHEIDMKYKSKFLFHLIGSGTFKNEVIQLSLATENVLVYDAVPNISDKLYAFDFIIMPSRFEGFGLISIEASYSKVPVIAAYAPGLTETLPPKWPLQFQLESSKELMTIFTKILNTEYDLDGLKEEAYTFVNKNFSLAQMVKSYSMIYAKCNV